MCKFSFANVYIYYQCFFRYMIIDIDAQGIASYKRAIQLGQKNGCQKMGIRETLILLFIGERMEQKSNQKNQRGTIQAFTELYTDCYRSVKLDKVKTFNVTYFSSTSIPQSTQAMPPPPPPPQIELYTVMENPPP